MLQRSHVWKENFKKEELLESLFSVSEIYGKLFKKVSLFVILAQCLFSCILAKIIH